MFSGRVVEFFCPGQISTRSCVFGQPVTPHQMVLIICIGFGNEKNITKAFLSGDNMTTATTTTTTIRFENAVLSMIDII